MSDCVTIAAIFIGALFAIIVPFLVAVWFLTNGKDTEGYW